MYIPKFTVDFKIILNFIIIFTGLLNIYRQIKIISKNKILCNNLKYKFNLLSQSENFIIRLFRKVLMLNLLENI